LILLIASPDLLCVFLSYQVAGTHPAAMVTFGEVTKIPGIQDDRITWKSQMTMS